MLGIAAVVGLAPRALTKNATAATAPSRPPTLPFAIKTEPRAVARRADSV